MIAFPSHVEAALIFSEGISHDRPQGDITCPSMLSASDRRVFQGPLLACAVETDVADDSTRAQFADWDVCGGSASIRHSLLYRGQASVDEDDPLSLSFFRRHHTALRWSALHHITAH